MARQGERAESDASQARLEPPQIVSLSSPTLAGSGVPRWNLSTRVVFRFCFVYFGLYCLTTKIFVSLFSFGFFSLPLLGVSWPMRQIVFWTAKEVFHVTYPLVYMGTGSGDKTFDWVEIFCLLVFAIFSTGLWSALDRRCQHYATLYKWFRVFIRFAVASQMIEYGIMKVFAQQMTFPNLMKLVEPLGNFSPMGVLWASIGAAPAYEIFAGSAEMLGGVLLFVPRTAMLGALICLADLTNVSLLNMTYDVPVKIFSFHLLLMSLFLLAPDFRRLAAFSVGRNPGSSAEPQLFRTRRARRIALCVQLVFGFYLLGTTVWGWEVYGGGALKSPLYGIWDVSAMSIDGQLRSPLLTDYDRYRRVIFDSSKGTRYIVFQRMDSSLVAYSASVDTQRKTIELAKTDGTQWKAEFSYQQPAPGQLILDGEMDSHKLDMQLRLFDHKKFLLVSRGFHWINEYSFNR